MHRRLRFFLRRCLGVSEIVASQRSKVKALALILFVLLALYVIRFTAVKDFFTRETLGGLLDSAGLWAPLIFVLIYAAGVCLFVPGTLLTALGAAIFGPYRGFLYVWVGAMAGASAWTRSIADGSSRT